MQKTYRGRGLFGGRDGIQLRMRGLVFQIAENETNECSSITMGQFNGNCVLLDSALGIKNVALQPFYEVQRAATAVGLVAGGVGAAVVPRLAIQKDTYPRIRVIELTDPVVARKKGSLSPAAQALYDMICSTESVATLNRAQRWTRRRKRTSSAAS